MNRMMPGFCLAAMMIATPAAAVRDTGRYTSLTVFGDSLVDAGNIRIVTAGATPDPTRGYVDGRFTNGYDYTDLLNRSLFGGNMRASLAGGSNYAFGGARIVDTADGIPDLAAQIATYRFALSSTGRTVDRNGLYILNMGGNDVFKADEGQIGGYADPDTYLRAAAGQYVDSIRTLNAAGVRNILLTGFPVTTSARNAAAERYLDDALAGLTLDADTTLFRFSYADFFGRVQSDPASLGLTPLRLDTSCIASGAQPDCAGIFSFDGIHPTAAVQAALFRDLDRQFALTAAANVPEPASWGLMLIGFGATGVALRRRRRRIAGLAVSQGLAG